MTALLDLAILVPNAALLALASFLAVEAAGSFLPRRRIGARRAGRIVVVIPAHDEEANVAATVEDARADLAEGDMVLVVADNCTDATASAAAAAGATVIERSDRGRRGKGYALQFALDHLRAGPPDIVVFVDADCRFERGTVRRLADVAAASGEPAQAEYLMRAPEGSPPARRAAEFAWIFMNVARMRGLDRLFGVCRMLGSGAAIPWALLKDRNLASGEIVEDLALSFDFAAQGAPARLCTDARVVSWFPISDESAARQRARWEIGSTRLARRRAPAMLARALMRGDIRLAALSLDVMIPPLAMFVAMLTVAAGLAALFGAGAALGCALFALVLVAVCVVAGWAKFGRAALPPAQFGALIRYALDKLSVWRGPARRSAETWTRTDRDSARNGPA